MRFLLNISETTENNPNKGGIFLLPMVFVKVLHWSWLRYSIPVTVLIEISSYTIRGTSDGLCTPWWYIHYSVCNGVKYQINGYKLLADLYLSTISKQGHCIVPFLTVSKGLKLHYQKSLCKKYRKDEETDQGMIWIPQSIVNQVNGSVTFI